MIDRRAVLASLLGLALSGCAPPLVQSNRISPDRVDHHVHVHSPTIRALLPQFCASVAKYGGCDAPTKSPLTETDLLAQMADAGIVRAILVSTGYLAVSKLMQPPRNNALQLLRSANAWTVEQAVQRPERFRAFVAVDPLHPNAVDEIAFWRGKPGVAGVKIHLTSAAADLRKPGDLAKISSVFKASSDAGLPVLVHLRTMRMDYGAEDVHLFLEHVAAVTKTPIQIAHAAGWGGVDAPTLQALNTFADALERQPARFGHVFFDLSGVWTEKTADQDLVALTSLIDRVGAQRFLPASDWPFSGQIKHYYDEVYPRLPLTVETWRTVLANVAPYAR